RCLTGFVTSLGVSLLVFVLVPVSTGHFEGLDLDQWGPNLVLALFGALVGAAMQLDDSTLTFTAIAGAVLSLGTLVAVAFVLRANTAIEYRMLERCEYGTVLLAAPIVALGVWWPVDIMAKYQQSRMER